MQKIKRYVPADLAAELIAQNRRAELGGARKDLTILFSDIENFTTWSETLSPEDLISIMAKYFAGMTEIIMRNHGTVDKYIGDAIMAFWGAHRVQGSFHVRALDAVAVKGKSAHIRIHELRGVSSGKPEEFEARFTEIANRATQLYFSRH